MKQSYEIEHQTEATVEQINKHIEYGNRFQATFGLLKEYCSNSTLHGVRYIVEKKRHWLERVWWIVGFTMSMCCFGALIYNFYDNWDQNSVIVSYADEVTPVWDIPFPAITICPSTKAELNISLFFAVEDGRFVRVSEDEIKKFIACSYIRGRFFDEITTYLENFNENSIIDLLRKIAPKLISILDYCRFTSKELKCEFEEIITEQGLCFTFNMLSRKETYDNDITSDFLHIGHNKKARWSLENGYDRNIEIDSQTYPHRVFRAGADGDKLNIGLKCIQQYSDTKCDNFKGFKIVLHTPGEIPQVSKYYFDISILQSVAILVKPNIITTSERLRRYHPNRRKCYFDAERKLRYLKVYTQRNCELECLSNFTLSLCGCVPFHMPRDENTPVCGHTKFHCSDWARNSVLKGQIRQQHDNKPASKQLIKRCNCLPACHSITYDAELLAMELLWGKEYYHSDLSIFFKENEFITLERSERYSLTDFIAYCGGLLGLFIGASILSIVELFYYCALRVCCKNQEKINQKRKRKH